MSPPRPPRAVLGLAILLSTLALSCGSDDDDPAVATADGSVLPGNGDASSGTDAAAPPTGSEAGVTPATPEAGAPPATPEAGAPDAARPPSQDAGTPTVDASQPRDAATQDSSPPNTSGLAKFSFFVTSEAAIRDLSKDPEGFGGDLRFGETGPGAGLRGADKICATIAERSMPGAGAKQWRAFLSASTDGAGTSPVHARDRIGQGPWYDRRGRLVGNALADLISGTRPSMADVQIRNDLPNETGTPNRAPDGTAVDNHDTLTGSDANGRYVSGANTCMDWTSTSNSGGGGGGGGFGGSGPNIGHSWPRAAGGGMGGSAMGAHWISDHRAGGCGKGINTMNGTTDGTATVGSGGGYGGFYCFALTP